MLKSSKRSGLGGCGFHRLHREEEFFECCHVVRDKGEGEHVKGHSRERENGPSITVGGES